MKVFNKKPIKSPNKQKGVAIVLAMSVVAFAALAAMAMVVSQSTWSRHLELGNNHTQALLISRGGLDWARAVLSDDSRAGNVDYLAEPWAIKLPSIPVENGSLSGDIEDQQGKFNLNNIIKDGKSNPSQLAILQRLLTTLALPPELADSLTAHGSLRDVAELVLVSGFDNSVRARLRPYVTALPRFTAVNVNTATPEVISAIVEGLSLDDARGITAQRERSFFRTPADFFNLLPRNLVVANENISVNSNYFIVSMVSNIHEAQAKGSALLARNGTAWPTIIWSRFQ